MGKTRKGSNPDTVYDQPEGSKIKKTKLSQFEETCPLEVGRRLKPQKASIDFRKEEIKRQEEPYNRQVATRLHTTNQEDLEKVLETIMGKATEEVSPNRKKVKVKKQGGD